MGNIVSNIKQFLKWCGKERIIETFAKPVRELRGAFKYETGILKFGQNIGTDVVQFNMRSAVINKVNVKQAAADAAKKAGSAEAKKTANLSPEFIKKLSQAKTPEAFEKLIQKAEKKEIEYLRNCVKQVAGKYAFGYKKTIELVNLIESRARILKLPQSVSVIRANFVEKTKNATNPVLYEKLINKAESISEVEYLQKSLKQVADKNAFGHEKTVELLQLMKKKIQRLTILKYGSTIRIGFIEQVERARTPEELEKLINETTDRGEIEYLRSCIKQIAGKYAFGYRKGGELAQLLENKSKLFGMTQLENAARMNFVEQVERVRTPKELEKLINETTDNGELKYLHCYIKQITGKNAFGYRKGSELIQLLESKL